MTDREAIRRLAEIVADLCYQAEMPMAKAVCEEIRRKASEPAAPTDDDQPCKHGGIVCEACAYDRGYDQGVRDACKTLNPDAPSVTREQAARVYAAVRFGWPFDFPIPPDDAMPAFFRAVADQLEKP